MTEHRGDGETSTERTGEGEIRTEHRGNGFTITEHKEGEEPKNNTEEMEQQEILQ